MIKLTANQLDVAVCCACEITSLEAAKDRVTDQTVRLQLEGGTKSISDPLGRGPLIDYRVPAAVVRNELVARIDAARHLLADLGIELVP